MLRRAFSAFARPFSLRPTRARPAPAFVMTMLSEIKLSHQDALRVADERLKDTSRVADERLKETSRVADERLKDLSRVTDAQLKVASERLEEVKASSAARVAAALYDLDVARGFLGARPLLEQSFLELRRGTARGGDGMRSGGSKGAMSQVLDELLPAKQDVKSSCPGLIAYLTVAATDNGLNPEQVLRSAKELYPSLSKLSHSTPVGMPEQLPEDVFAGWGEESRLAFAAIVTFSGRRMSFYARNSALAPYKLRNISGCSVTVEAVRAAPLVE